MATQIIADSTQILCINTVDNSKIACLDLFTFAYREHSTDVYILEDGNNTGIKVRLADAVDEDGNTFATSADLVAYLSTLSQESANLGKTLKIDNMVLSNTGSHVQLENENTGEKSFLVQQRVTSQGTQKVYYVEQSETEQVEHSGNAYQKYKTHTKKGVLNNQGRYAMAVDFTSIQNVFIKEYRSHSIADINGDGLKNVNVKIFTVTTNPDDETKFRPLSGIGILEGWHISKRPYWVLNKQATIDTGAGGDIAAGEFAFNFADGFSFKAGDAYRMVISADNEFELYGVEGAPNPFGGTLFIPYVERTYTGEVEVEVETQAAKVFNDAIDFTRDSTNTNINTSEGDSYNVNAVRAINDNGTIKILHSNNIKEYYKNINHELVTIAGSNITGSVDDVVNALNALFTVTQGQLSTSITSPQVDALGTATTNNTYANVIDPIGDASFALSSGTHGVVYSDERINEPGEYFTFSILGKNYHGIGLFNDTVDSNANGISDHLEELQSSTTSRYLGNQFSMWIHLTVAAWQFYGENTGFAYMEGYSHSDPSQRWQTSTEYQNLATTPVGMKVGINTYGYLVVSYWNVAQNRYIDIVRTSYILDTGNYGLYYAMGSTSSQMYDAPKVHLIDEAAPILTYYAIQSIDWKYPLFTTAEQANYYDLQNGGTGTSTINIYPDDTTQTQWYAPDNGFTSNGVSVPQNTDSITWNIIPSEVLTPAAYPNTTIEVNEGASFNIAIDPADHNWSTTVTGESWASLVGNNLQGTAPTVTGDNVSNPNDEYQFTITRTLEGSILGTLTIRVINLTAPVNPISGFNHVTGSTAMIDADTLDDGSVVHVNTQVSDGERFVIEKAYIQTNILPNLTQANDMYIIGLHNTASDFSTLELADFDAAIVWEWESSTSHTFKFYRDGSVVQNVVINSLTDGYYDYAIEADGTSAWLIACNVNSIMNEPSPNDGGSFSHTYEVTNTEDTAPLQIHIAALNTTGDISTTDIETITTPTAPAITTTPFTKALDFSGSSEHTKQVSNNSAVNPLQQAGGWTAAAPTTSGNTTADPQGRPFFAYITFKYDGNSTNQHIWNYGEGTGSTDDNIYLRLDASGYLYLGWGRQGALNECKFIYLGTSINTNHWHGIYIGYNGTRLSGANATASNLADCFDIRWFTTNNGGTWGSWMDNKSTVNNWTNGTTGGGMDRTVTGNLTVGGRSSNRSFHGKVASMVVSTLIHDTPMPDNTEIEMIATNPIKWLEDYKVGNNYRFPSSTGFTPNFQLNNGGSSYSCQVWLFGDVSLDNFSNGLRNYVLPTDQNYTKMQLNSMASNDFVNVNINGLT